MPLLRLAAWNVQNLFEVGAVTRGPQSQGELDAKLDRLAEIIRQFFNLAGPDLLGLCEVHTEALLKKLASRLGGQYSHRWVAPITMDQTGLGVLFRSEVLPEVEVVHEYRPTLAARPRVAVFKCKLVGKAEPFLFALNHWKSRMQHGAMDPEADRLETARWFAELMEKQDRIPTVVAVGDFNAEPDEAVFGLKGMRVERFFSHVLHWKNRPTHFYSPMWRLLSEPDFWEQASAAGYQESRPKTSFAESNNLFDHLMVSSRVLQGGPLTLREMSVEIFHQWAGWGGRGLLRPIRWSYDDATGNGTGASDHFPLLAVFDY